MSESKMLYDLIPLVAELNRVDGFNPKQYLRTYSDEKTGEAQYYLDVKYRKLWFRLKNPNGKIIKKIVQLTDKVATVEARVYLDAKDPEDNFIASAFAQRSLDSGPFGAKYVELAETAAVGRALADAGFGVQFCDVTEPDDPAIVDAGIPAPVKNASPAPAVVEDDGSAAAAGAAPAAGGPASPSTAPAAAPAAPAAGLVTPPAPAYTSDTPIEKILELMTLEEAKAVKVDFKAGVHKDKTLAQIAFESPKDLQWLAESYKGRNNLIKAGAQKLLQAATYEPQAS